jgi:hypothetical protein
MKKLISLRISALTEAQLHELTTKLGMSQTETVTLAVNNFYDKMEEKMNSANQQYTLLEYARSQVEAKNDIVMNYVGQEFWGDDGKTTTMTWQDVVDYLEGCGVDGEICSDEDCGWDWQNRPILPDDYNPAEGTGYMVSKCSVYTYDDMYHNWMPILTS